LEESERLLFHSENAVFPAL